MGETVILRPGPSFDTDGSLVTAAGSELAVTALGVEPLGDALAEGPGREGETSGHKLYLPTGCPVGPGWEALVRGAWHVVRSVSSWRSPRGTGLGGTVAVAYLREG